MAKKNRKYKWLQDFANKHKNAVAILGSTAVGLILFSTLPDPANAVALITCMLLGVLYISYNIKRSTKKG